MNLEQQAKELKQMMIDSHPDVYFRAVTHALVNRALLGNNFDEDWQIKFDTTPLSDSDATIARKIYK